MTSKETKEVELMATARMDKKPTDYDSLVLQLIDYTRRLERAHAWFVKNTKVCDCPYNIDGWAKDWSRAKDLTL